MFRIKKLNLGEMMSEKLTNNEAREIFKQSGLDYSVLTRENADLLRYALRDELKAFKNNGFTMQLAPSRKNDFVVGCYFECDVKGFIDGRTKEMTWNRRPAIAFNDDKFIGFCGWASTKNSQPILRAFVKWVEQVKNSG
jgi:hypothetical protein